MDAPFPIRKKWTRVFVLFQGDHLRGQRVYPRLCAHVSARLSVRQQGLPVSGGGRRRGRRIGAPPEDPIRTVGVPSSAAAATPAAVPDAFPGAATASAGDHSRPAAATASSDFPIGVPSEPWLPLPATAAATAATTAACPGAAGSSKAHANAAEAGVELHHRRDQQVGEYDTRTKWYVKRTVQFELQSQVSRLQFPIAFKINGGVFPLLVHLSFSAIIFPWEVRAIPPKGFSRDSEEVPEKREGLRSERKKFHSTSSSSSQLELVSQLHTSWL